MQAAVTLIVVLVGALADNIDKVIDAAFTLVDSLVNALLQDDNLSKILNSAVRLVIEISTGLSPTFRVPGCISADRRHRQRTVGQQRSCRGRNCQGLQSNA